MRKITFFLCAVFLMLNGYSQGSETFVNTDRTTRDGNGDRFALNDSKWTEITISGTEGGSYCTGEGVEFSEYGGMVENFSTSNGIANIDNQNIEDPIGYHDFTDMVVSQEAGQSFNFTVDIIDMSYGDAGISVFIDYNNDFEFDYNSSELVYTTIDFEESVTATITIPENTAPGNYRLRVTSDQGNSSPGPCDAVSSIHDYTLIVLGENSEDCEAPTAVEVTNISQTSAVITWTAGGDEIEWEIAYGETGFDTETEGEVVSVNNTPELTLENLEEGADYDVYVRAICGTDDNSIWTGPQNFTTESSSYCIPTTVAANSAPVRAQPDRNTNFTITGAVENFVDETTFEYGSGAGTTVDNAAPNGYADLYDTYVVKQFSGESFNFSVDYKGTGVNYYIWIDFNQDNQFDDSDYSDTNTDGERFYMETTGQQNPTFTGTITIPENIEAGEYRMRIRGINNISNLSDLSCDEIAWGEARDYKLEVLEDEIGYCAPFLDCSDGDVITNVTFQEINNTTTCSANGYGDYTNLTATVQANGVYPISVTVGDGWINESVSVWIDFDGSDTFDEDEFFYIGTGSDETLTGEIAIPADVVDGDYKMRVRVAAVGELEATWDMACDESQGFGETEDYTVTVDGILGVNDNTITDFIYYPNPMKDVLHISASEGVKSVSVYNMLGQMVLSNRHSVDGKVDVTSLPTGTYLFNVTFDNGHKENFQVIKK